MTLRLYRAWAALITALVVPTLLFGPLAPARAQSVVTTVPTGQVPQSVAVNSATNRAYVTNDGDDNVSVYDITNATPTEIAPRIPVGAPLQGVDVNTQTNRIYVNLGGAIGGTAVINGATNAVLTTVATGGFGTDVAVDEMRNLLIPA